MFCPLQLLVLVVVLLSSSKVTTALQIYQDYIPNGKSFPNHPSLGHVAKLARPSNHRLNQFGRDFKAAGYAWTVDLCRKDSDRDGRTNGEELGDPECTWFRGDDDPAVKGITNPGVRNKFFAGGGAQNSSTLSPALAEEEQHDDRDDYQAGMSDAQHDFDSGEALPTWLVFHAVLMFMSFGLLVPAGMLFPYYLRHRANWRDEHMKIMLVGKVIGFVGFVIAAAAAPSGSGSFHGTLGWFIVLLALMQGVVGSARRRLAYKYGREAWQLFHSRLGRTILLLVVLQVLLGYVQMSAMTPTGGNAGLVIWGMIHASMLAGVLFMIQLKLKMRAFEPEENMGPEEDLGFSELPKVVTGD